MYSTLMLLYLFLKLVTREFAFDWNLLEAAKDFLQQSATVKFGKTKNVTFVSIHNRRTGVNFINVLQTTFMCPDHKSAENTVKASVFLRFWDLGE